MAGKLPMSAEKTAKHPNLKGGSRKRIPNKVSADLKAMILGALDEAGGMSYLVEQARNNPNPFLSLVGKVLPLTLAGDPLSPLELSLAIGFVNARKPD